MRHQSCINFLQHHLPKLGYRWKGFRKVRKQVCKRINRRMRELELEDIKEYRQYLENHEDEMSVLDAMCNITISRFYRDRGIYEKLTDDILPSLARKGLKKQQENIRCWSAGSASGEEPYTLSIIWKLAVLPGLEKDIPLNITATDRNEHMIKRAKNAVYPGGAMKELPSEWQKRAFEKKENDFRLKNEFKQNVKFLKQDIRYDLPDGEFDIILCRNLVFTYFNEDLQKETFNRMITKLKPGGYFIVGSHESLPGENEVLRVIDKGIYEWGMGESER